MGKVHFTVTEKKYNKLIQMWGVRGYPKLFQRDTYFSSQRIEGAQCEYIYSAENANQLVRINIWM